MLTAILLQSFLPIEAGIGFLMWIGLQITACRLEGLTPIPTPTPTPIPTPTPTPNPHPTPIQAAAFEGDDTPHGWRHGPAIALGLLPSISAWSWSRIERVFEAMLTRARVRLGLASLGLGSGLS